MGVRIVIAFASRPNDPGGKTVMAIDSTAPRSRRALLGGVLGGLGGLLASRFASPPSAEAAAGSALIIGSETNNAGTSNTQLVANSDVVTFKLYQTGPGTALMGYTTTATGLTRGVYGRVDSANGDGVQGRNAGPLGSGAGVRAYGGNNSGVYATTDVAASYAIYGENLATTGGAIGIKGKTDDTGALFGDAAGVLGLAAGGHAAGVLGFANGDGAGVYAFSNTGPSIYADSGGSSNWAAQLKGRVEILASNPYIQIAEYAPGMNSSPSNADSDTVRLFAKDNGSGKAQLCAIFPGGAAVVIATEP
jgi:hypothetical protein